MKIALASAKFKNNDVPFNLRQIEDCMLQAKEAGAELVCFGEAFLQGFDALTWYWERDRDVAVTTDSEVFRALERLTADTGIDLLVGFLEREGEEIYSSCALLSEGRAVHTYRRISRGWKDFRKTDGHYREGREVTPFRWRGRTCLIALCGDLWDAPERFRQGQDLLFWPVYVNFPLEEWREAIRGDYAEQARSVCPRTLLIASVTAPPDPEASGGCADYGPGGAVLEPGREGVLIVEV